MSFKRTLLGYAEAVAALAIIGTMIRPGNQTQKILEAHSNALSASIRAATGGAVIQDLRTAAEKFHEEAMRAIGEFWKGFTEEDE